MRAGLYRLILVLGDIAIFYTALALALAIRRPDQFSLDYYLFNVSFFSAILPVFLGVNGVLGLYDFRQIRELADIIRESLLSLGYTLVAALGIFYVFSARLPMPKTNLAITLFIASVLGLLWRRLWMAMSASSLFATKTLFLGDNPIIHSLIADMKSHEYSRFRLVPMAVFERWQTQTANRCPDPAHLRKRLFRIVDLVVVDSELAMSDPKIQGIITAAVDSGVPIWTHTDFYEDFYKKVPINAVRSPAWLLANVLHRRNAFYVLLKRLFDVLSAVAILFVLLPFWPFIALAIKLTDGGPVFFFQERAGYLKGSFRMWKFRTMRVGADKAGYLWTAGKPDPRITPVGHILRKFRVDEFPQFINVIKGEMSLVGPRPTWDGETQVKDIAEYQVRRLVKPGITGWAQINSAATDSAADTLEKLSYDLYYVKNMSFALDLSILLKTLRRVFQSDQSFRRKYAPAAASSGAAGFTHNP